MTHWINGHEVAIAEAYGNNYGLAMASVIGRRVHGAKERPERIFGDLPERDVIGVKWAIGFMIGSPPVRKENRVGFDARDRVEADPNITACSPSSKAVHRADRCPRSCSVRRPS